MSGITSTSENVSEIEVNLRLIGRLIITFFRVFLGAWMIVSGWNHVGPLLGFPYVFPQPLGNLHLSNVMMVSLIEVGLFDLVKILEVLAGICLLFNRFVQPDILIEELEVAPHLVQLLEGQRPIEVVHQRSAWRDCCCNCCPSPK